jgi:hypothetical protein
MEREVCLKSFIEIRADRAESSKPDHAYHKFWFGRCLGSMEPNPVPDLEIFLTDIAVSR